MSLLSVTDILFLPLKDLQNLLRIVHYSVHTRQEYDLAVSAVLWSAMFSSFTACKQTERLLFTSLH